MKERRKRNAFPTTLILISIMGLSPTGKMALNDSLFEGIIISVYSVE